MITVRRICSMGALAWALAAGASRPAGAQEVPTFPRVYQWETPQEGWLELSLWETYVPSSDLPYQRFGLDATRRHLWAHALEIEYGVTDRLSLAAYADFDDPTGRALSFTQARVEARYRLFDRYQRLINPALYVEWSWPRGSYGASEELEARLILERDLGDVRVAVNPILTRALSGDEAQHTTSLGLAAGIYERRLWIAQPGLELFWYMGPIGSWPGFRRQYFLLGPSGDVNLTPAFSFHVSAGFGLTNGTDDLMVRGFLTYQLDTVRPAGRQM
jgi:hypothetical protein